MRPFATNLQLEFSGVVLTELEPPVMPNLYFGAPVRVYGRYRGEGPGDITIRGSMQGVEFKETARLEFPKSDDANPEINRLWAWHRIHSLLKEADRKGDRSAAIPQIVRLGEEFSIATEYTSFIVLENDAEYQRWKIARKNLASIGSDRHLQAKRREQLDAIRNKALSEIGPEAAARQPISTPVVQMASARQAVSPAPTIPPAPPQPERPPKQSRSADFHVPGSSPVGPIGVLLAGWFLRRKQRANAA